MEDLLLYYTVIEIKVLQGKNIEYWTEEMEDGSEMFLCGQCDLLLYNPVTLPCGHTMCKQCALKKMCCCECDMEFIADTCVVNTFLVDLISSWFEGEYNIRTIMKEAKNQLDKKEYIAGLETVNKVLLSAPKNYTALLIRSEIYSQLQKHKDALTDAELACKINSDGKSEYRRAQCYSNVADLDNALDAFQLCLRLEPDNMELTDKVVAGIDELLSLPDPLDQDDIQARLQILESPDINNSSDIESEDNESKLDDNDKQLCGETCKSFTSNSYLQLCTKSRVSQIDNSEDISLNTTDEISVVKFHGVSTSLIIEEDFECKLCYDLLYQPVTTCCGHVFCKKCIERTLDHNPYCPICRVSLKDYLSNPSKPVTVLLVTVLDLYLNKQSTVRENAYMLRLKELSRVGIDKDIAIPIFVCSIAFPYVTCPLHIFEPKYRLMVRECLESGSKKFGMCIPKSGQAADGEFSDIGTICEITKSQVLPDGRFIIHTLAGQRFLIRNKKIIDSLFYAEVTYFCDTPEELDANQYATTSKLIYDQLATYVNSLKTAERDCIFNALGRLPNYDDRYEQFQHGIPWVWWGLAALPLNMTAKLVLLRSKCVSERMNSLQRFLRFLTKINTPET